MYTKKFALIDSDGSQYSAYVKGRGNPTPNTKQSRESYNIQARIVPEGPNWIVPTGTNGHTLATLEDDGNGVTFNLKDKTLRINYEDLYYIKHLIELTEKLDTSPHLTTRVFEVPMDVDGWDNEDEEST